MQPIHVEKRDMIDELVARPLRRARLVVTTQAALAIFPATKSEICVAKREDGKEEKEGPEEERNKSRSAVTSSNGRRPMQEVWLYLGHCGTLNEGG